MKNIVSFQLGKMVEDPNSILKHSDGIGRDDKFFIGENLVNVCAVPHREHPCEHSAFQRIKCRFRCSHPRTNLLCRQRYSLAINRQSIWLIWRIGSIITSVSRGILNLAYFMGGNLVKVCAMSHREHLCEHPFFQRIKCRFRCSHPRTNLLCKQHLILTVNWQSIGSIWRIGSIITSASRSMKNREYSVGENLANVCALPHSEHPCKHSAVQCIKCCFRCSHPHANFHCKQHLILTVNRQSIGSIWRIGSIITSASRSVMNREYSVGENLVKVCAMPHREHPCEHSVVQRIKLRFRCSHPRTDFHCKQHLILTVNRKSIRRIWQIGQSITSASRSIRNREYSVGENLANVCALPHSEHPCKHSAVQCIKCCFRCSHPHANFHCKQHLILTVNRQSIGSIWRIGSIITSASRSVMNREYSVGENLVKVCAMPYREHPCEHLAVQRIKCRFRCSHPRTDLLCKQHLILTVNRQSIGSIWLICPIITPARPRRWLKSASVGLFGVKNHCKQKIIKKNRKKLFVSNVLHFSDLVEHLAERAEKSSKKFRKSFVGLAKSRIFALAFRKNGAHRSLK